MDMFEDIYQKLQDLQKAHEDLQESNLAYAAENAILRQQLEDYKAKEVSNQSKVNVLYETIQSLEEERKHLNELLNIVNLEQRNQQLMVELEELKKKCSLATKIIKGVTYFVDENLVLYTKNEDGSQGPKVGYLKIKDQKTLVVWS
jgi:chromosome segregation ATPase